MQKKELKKEYTHGEFTVVWQPAKCIHAEVCVKTLPHVYNPNEKPWIKPENAPLEALKNQIDKCPSGALSYYIKNQKPITKDQTMTPTKVKVTPGGPLLIEGKLEVTLPDGSQKIHENITAFCRCGASSNKPYCDGTHSKINFQG